MKKMNVLFLLRKEYGLMNIRNLGKGEGRGMIEEICPRCEWDIDEYDDYCRRCGYQLRPKEIRKVVEE